MDSMHEDRTYADESIDTLEKCLLNFTIIMKPLAASEKNDLPLNQVSSTNEEKIIKRRKIQWKINQVLMTIAMVRYFLLAFAHKENLMSKVFGDTFRNFGPTPRTVFYASIVGQGSFAVGFEWITHYFERRKLLDYLNDMKTLKGLSPENYR